MPEFTFGQFLPLKSPIHRLGAGLKVVGLAGALILLSVAKGAPGLSILGFLLGIGVILAQIPGPVFLSFLKRAAALAFLSFFLSAFLTPGKPILTLGTLRVLTVQGVSSGTVFASRVLLFLGFTSLFLWSTSPVGILRAFDSVPGKRFRRWMRWMSFVLMLSFTFVPVLVEEARRIGVAQRARCGLRDAGFLSKIRDISTLTIPLISSVLRKSEILARSLRMRGYEP